jgi:hypothetical protein
VVALRRGCPIIPDFREDERINGGETFIIMAEDVDGEVVLFQIVSSYITQMMGISSLSPYPVRWTWISIYRHFSPLIDDCHVKPGYPAVVE